MSSLEDALTWSGTEAALCLFMVWPDRCNVGIRPPEGVTQPRVVRTYELQDGDSVLGGKSTTEIDLIFSDVPEDIDAVVEGWLRSSIREGAQIAWFGFEGSFDFGHILSADIANQIYGVAYGSVVVLATDDQVRVSGDWADQLGIARQALADPLSE